ncbi:MaoC family dehydratase [Propylenella binzhouense]|uniref:MaoC family dehydratase n=1 Tax=Propylenella binzhouense TaxID=2555902 RepID=A0A964WSF2_9HYPH|nr:MaoC family dehydratase [Propylenella binzhouense]MYZ46745.1 MaoC family dehydratase [Propylenella binzhouense]
MRYFEDLTVGTVWPLGTHTFTAEDIKRFATAFDPQPFHVDEAAAERSHFGRLCASGWHTVSIWMRLNVLNMQRMAQEMQAAGEPLARKGPSPGFEDLKWLKPVHAGDAVTYETEIAARRPSRSRPGWGLVTLRNSGRNQRGELVLTFQSHVFVEMRAAEPTAEADEALADQ